MMSEASVEVQAGSHRHERDFTEAPRGWPTRPALLLRPSGDADTSGDAPNSLSLSPYGGSARRRYATALKLSYESCSACVSHSVAPPLIFIGSEQGGAGLAATEVGQVRPNL